MRPVAFAFAAALIATPALAEVKIAHDFPPNEEDSGGYVWAKAFEDHLNANGMEAVGYARNALGEEAERLDQVSQGLLEISMSDVKSAGQLDKLIYGVYLPFLFEDAAGFDRAIEENGLLDRINEGTTPEGVRVLGFQALGLPSGIFNTKQPVATLEDIGALRMRALDETQIALYESWGSTGTMVSWSEVPNALQTGVADGYLNPPIVPLLFGHTDFITHFTDARITPAMRIIIASEDWYQGLSDEERGTVDEGVRLATAANREWLAGRTTVLDDLKAAGIEVLELSDEARASFIEASESVYEDGVLTPDQVQLWLDAAGR
ncbi:MAG: TRAP transporter substrate-binding protein [Pseudomonadota bacterium]